MLLLVYKGRRGIMFGGGGEFGYLNIPQRLKFYVVCTKKNTWLGIIFWEGIEKESIGAVYAGYVKIPINILSWTVTTLCKFRGRLNIWLGWKKSELVA